MAKILIVTWNFPPTVGGIENLIGEIYQNLSRYHDVTVITAGDPIEEEDPCVIRIKAKSVGVFLARAPVKVMSTLIRQRFDLIISGSLLMSPITIPCGMLTRTTRISMSYGLDIIYPNPFYQLMIRIAFRMYRVVVTISENSKDLLLAKGLRAGKISVIYPGVSTKFIRALDNAHKPDYIRKRFGIGDKPCLLSVGRLAKRKGIHPFVRHCLPLVIQEVPDCVFMIVGDDPEGALVHRGGEMALVREVVAELGIEDHVLFAGKVTDTDLIGIYRAADLFVFPVLDIPYDVEGFGMVAIEAALVGRTSVGSNVGGIPDAIEDGVSGLLVPPGDYKNFADKVILLLKDTDVREVLEEKARERVLTKLSWDTIIDDWNDLIARITGK